MSALKEQVLEVVARWSKYISDKKIEANSDQILIDLDNLIDIPFTKELVQSTGLALRLAPMRKCGASDVRQRADTLFKKLAEASKKQAAPMRSTSKEETEEKRKRFRDIFYKKLLEAEEELTEPAVIGPHDLAVAIEKAIWEMKDREDRVKRLLSALCDKAKMAEMQFPKKLLLGTLKPERFAAFESEDLMTEAQIQKVAQDKQEAMKKNAVPKPAFAHSSSFKCRRCHSNYLGHRQMQTRSADEPMTNFLVCGDCGYEWRE